jgi:hypothetical protein
MHGYIGTGNGSSYVSFWLRFDFHCSSYSHCRQFHRWIWLNCSRCIGCFFRVVALARYYYIWITIKTLYLQPLYLKFKLCKRRKYFNSSSMVSIYLLCFFFCQSTIIIRMISNINFSALLMSIGPIPMIVLIFWTGYMFKNSSPYKHNYAVAGILPTPWQDFGVQELIFDWL